MMLHQPARNCILKDDAMLDRWMDHLKSEPGDAHRRLQPPGWPKPKGYANGIMARGQIVVTGGVVGWDEKGIFADSLAAQVKQVLLNISAILDEAGIGPRHVVRLTWYVTDMAAYRASLPAIGAAYREVFGKNFPAMALVQVVSLVEHAAMVEIEATAVIPESMG
jgi:enamine deaminase RidA (YjgF/YER057c/UK114 family)